MCKINRMNTKLLVEQLNTNAQNTLVSRLGIEFTEAGPHCVKAKMPVDERTRQPFGLLHGGASAALAETLGSVASALNVDGANQVCVGLEINANHLRGISEGYVYGTALPLHLGRRTHVWEIKIIDDDERLISVSRLTVMVMEQK